MGAEWFYVIINIIIIITRGPHGFWYFEGWDGGRGADWWSGLRPLEAMLLPQSSPGASRQRWWVPLGRNISAPSVIVLEFMFGQKKGYHSFFLVPVG